MGEAKPETAKPEAGSEAEDLRRILHCDMDSFYASVHIRDDPTLAGKPVVIGGAAQSRGVVAAASYEARSFGVHSAMPSAQAYRLCPQAVFIKPDFSRYRSESAEIFAIYRSFTPVMQTVSLDEAYLDVTEHLGGFETATAVAREIRRRVREERRLTVSVGVGPNRLIAKIASDFNKPNGLTVVPPEKVRAFLDPQPVRRLQGVGPATEKALLELGVEKISELRGLTLEALEARFGKHGRGLYLYARGIDRRAVSPHRIRKSLGSENTFRHDLRRRDEMEAELERLAAQVAQGLEKRDLTAGTVTLKARYPDFTTVTRALSLPSGTRDPEVLLAAACLLLDRTEALERGVRLLGVTASRLVEGGPVQGTLFPLL